MGTREDAMDKKKNILVICTRGKRNKNTKNNKNIKRNTKISEKNLTNNNLPLSNLYATIYNHRMNKNKNKKEQKQEK